MKTGLVISYSQIGQTKKAIESFCEGASDYQWDHVEIKPKRVFSFPYKMTLFFRLFPLCITDKGTDIESLNIDTEKNYDLVVIGYQVWFLSPSLPIQALLKDADFQKVANGKNVLGIVTCRNMWVSAVGRVNKALRSFGVKAIKNLVICDRSPAWASFVTTPRWMLTGKKGAFLFFPAAGILEKDLRVSRDLGAEINSKGYENADSTSYSHRQAYGTILMERLGYPVFVAFGQCIESVVPKENILKDLSLVLFRLCLVSIILVLLPLTAILSLTTLRFFGKRADLYINHLLQG